MALLEVSGIAKAFGGLRVIGDLSFSMEKGETLGLIGPNGSGKTTLFNMIAGFLRPDAGRIVFDGEDLAGRSPSRTCRAGIARTFQLVKPFLSLSALDNVAAGRAYGRQPAPTLRRAQEEAAIILDRMGLGAKKHVPAGQLNLLDRKRLEIARSYATVPKLLLLDEVFAGLNHGEVVQAIELIGMLKKMGVTLMIVEHVLKVILGVSDRVLVINAGEKIFEGRPAEAVKDAKVGEAYLGKDFCALPR
ncbi:MAG: ABC transporter ATP-binding protein [Deltaproteobacteria bacterium]|nr:ABC transporter ATP-binding protein [Deltaproteobacteria bacterium]